MEIFDTEPTLTEEALGDYEAMIGCRLPNDYRAFLKIYNGGRPVPNGFAFNIELTNESDVRAFLSISDADNFNAYKYVLAFKGRLPPGFVPVATDSGGNLILIGTFGKYLGEIRYWDHESELSPPDLSNTYLVAMSFTEFIGNLIP